MGLVRIECTPFTSDRKLELGSTGKYWRQLSFRVEVHNAWGPHAFNRVCAHTACVAAFTQGWPALVLSYSLDTACKPHAYEAILYDISYFYRRIIS
jgi:hypothetical protein